MTKPDFTSTFNDTLATRNPAQRKAIDAIDGPVLVLAGPGTGKTDVLTLRIGNILLQTDTEPHNILCLTYTESGAFAMRNRLAQYIGPAAYNVHIHTFHAFCNLIIPENPPVFGFYRELQPITPLEKMEILMAITDKLDPEHPLRRLKGDIYFDSRRMGKTFDLMKRENWSPEHMIASINSYIEERENSDDYRYQKKYKEFLPGDFKEAKFKKEVIDKMDTLRAAVELFPAYQERMRDLGRYDFNDMLRWVFDAFNEDPELLVSYQERFLYFLVDEFQDTNGIQLDLLGQLLSYWEESPNVFVVGDDDQAIFRFQGANVENIRKFRRQYNPQISVLTENYRSAQGILDNAMHLIRNNEERLVNEDPSLSKHLTAMGPLQQESAQVSVVRFADIFAEEAFISSQLVELHQQGILDKEQVAVIYRKHSQAENLLKILEQHKVPVQLKRQVNILEEPIIRNLLLLIEYVWDSHKRRGEADSNLYKLMHLRYFGIPVSDVAKLAVTRPKEGNGQLSSLRDRIADVKVLDQLQVNDKEAILRFSDFLDITQAELFEFTFQVFFEKLITRSGLLDFIYRSPERYWYLKLLTALFDFIKIESEKNPSLSMEQFLMLIEKLQMHKLWLPAKQLIREQNAVQFITAHSAKGLEFDRVFLLGCIERNWEKQAGRSDEYSLPTTLAPASRTVSEEDERRLFYVAMTRARQHLQLSYHVLNAEEKEVGRSKFIEEVLDGGSARLQEGSVDEETILRFHFERMQSLQSAEAPFIDHDLVNQVLENFPLSVTAINKYLECPRRFYFENILTIPAARNAPMGFGSAIHKALEKFFEQIKSGLPKAMEILLRSFDDAMKYYSSHFTEKEFEDTTLYGHQVLTAYFNEYEKTWTEPANIRHEYRIKNVEHLGIPLSGFIDRIELNGGDVTVMDYKTGRYKPDKFHLPSEKSEYGGDYWRQIVFYKILIDIDPRQNWMMQSGIVDYIEPDKDGKFKQVKVTVRPEDIRLVEDQIQFVHNAIHEHRFEDGCDEDFCYWCALVNDELSPKLKMGKEEFEE